MIYELDLIDGFVVFQVLMWAICFIALLKKYAKWSSPGRILDMIWLSFLWPVSLLMSIRE